MQTDAGERAREEVPRRADSRAQRLARDAALHLAAALGAIGRLHEPGERERHRRRLESAIDCAQRALEAAGVECAELSEARTAELEHTSRTVASVRAVLAHAHCARAQDASHGAGQLSLSAQRAPTQAACDDGWLRVETIARVAEASARAAATFALQLEEHAPGSAPARKAAVAARKADVAARSARRLVEQRNHAYTFHADSRFSFGEGWYLAAAAVLAGVAVQVEPGKDQTASAEAFLRSAGLGQRLQPYRSRPRAMKHTTELVARGFRADPLGAQRRLRAAFLGDEPISHAVKDWLDHELSHLPAARAKQKKVVLWIRDGIHHPQRNTTYAELMELTARIESAGLVPLWTGDAVREGEVPPGVVDLVLFWKHATFQGIDMRRAQLQFFEHLKLWHGVLGQLGVTTAGMDGPALMGLPTLYLTDAPNVRMGQWVDAVPGYREVVRGEGYLERVGRVLAEWAGSPLPCGS